jgi:Tfp pilus assembly protein PilV
MMNSRQQQGFGLLEVVISSGILALVVGATTGLVRSSLRRTVLAADRSVAMNLAQEGIEQVRSVRDSLYIDRKSNSFTDVLPINDQTAVHLEFSTQDGSWLIKQEPEKLTQNDIEFTRELYITAPVSFGSPDDQQLVRKIRVIVRWDDGNQSVESATYLTNWRSGI